MADLPPLHRPAAPILVDALNVAWWCGQPPALRLPLALLAGLLQAGHEARLVFDASAPHQLGADAAVYRQLLLYPRHAIEVPSGRRADGVMLREATSARGLIISRDRYRDYRSRYRKLIDDSARLLAGEVREDCIHVPALGLSAPLPATAQAAWATLLPWLTPSG